MIVGHNDIEFVAFLSYHDYSLVLLLYMYEMNLLIKAS